MFHLPQNSTLAGGIDSLFNFIFWISVIGLVGVTVTIGIFISKYRRSKIDPDKTPYIEGHAPSEIGVSVVLFVLGMAIFYWGWIGYGKIISPSGSNPLEINVVAKQWQWEFEYANGHKTINELVVPKDTPVKLIMTSSDVLHSFYVPNFRIKNDVVPNRYSTYYFTANKISENKIFCAEYCGTAHSKMLGNLKVVDAAEYTRWQASWELNQRLGVSESKEGGGASNPVEKGQALYTGKGCNACHAVTGQRLVGPSWKGIFGLDEEMADGSKIKVDENYLRESIMEPQVKLMKGFPPVMPTYKGQLSDADVNAIIADIKSLK